MADAGRTARYGNFANRLSEHLIGRVTKAIEHGLHRLARLASGEDNAFKNGEQEMALNSLADALDLKKWKDLERNIRQPTRDGAADRLGAEACSRLLQARPAGTSPT